MNKKEKTVQTTNAAPESVNLMDNTVENVNIAVEETVDQPTETAEQTDEEIVIETDAPEMNDHAPETAEQPKKRGRKPKSEGSAVQKQKKEREPKVDYPEYTTENMSAEDLQKYLISEMKTRNVRFTFKNKSGKSITTNGTLRMEKVPTTRVVTGKRTPREEGYTVFFDVRHGIFRQFNKDCITAVNVPMEK